jgi:hypothetical protein
MEPLQPGGPLLLPGQDSPQQGACRVLHVWASEACHASAWCAKR